MARRIRVILAIAKKMVNFHAMKEKVLCCIGAIQAHAQFFPRVRILRLATFLHQQHDLSEIIHLRKTSL